MGFFTKGAGTLTHGQDFMHNSMINMSRRGLYENMAVYGSGMGALGAGIGGIGGSIYGDRDTDVLSGAGIGLGLGLTLGAGGAFAFKPKANQYVKGLNARYNSTMNNPNLTDEQAGSLLNELTMGYSKGNWAEGASLIGPGERHVKMVGLPMFAPM